VYLDGFLGIDKPPECTSHDVVDQVRRLFKIKKVGHTGTLDPMATGVLVLCLGKFTRLSQFVTASDKTYRATIQLGVETDTQDREGEVVSTSSQLPDKSSILGVLPSFLGKSEQIPPMHSAVRVGGKRLYELARAGKEVERTSRPIEIFELNFVEYQAPELVFDVRCSKGTYIRTLAADMGQRLGCGAHLVGLQRTEVGNIALSDCFQLTDLDAASAPDYLIDPKRVLGLPQIKLTSLQIQKFVNGNLVSDVCGVPFDNEQDLCVFDDEDVLIGIARGLEDGIKPVRVIAQRES
jgi:tRNA pseudouridine55 synthase